MKCDFCSEFRGEAGSQFSEKYPDFDSRIVFEDQDFLVLPTIGQIFPNSFLILPRTHYQTCGEMPAPLRSKLERIVGSVLSSLHGAYDFLVFEHGAKAHTGASCGIYHAHTHIVPIPSNLHVDIKKIFPDHSRVCSSLVEALDIVKDSEDYLMLGTGQEFLTARVSDLGFVPRSQYFRRQLVKYLQVDEEWDWRKYDKQEMRLLDARLLKMNFDATVG